MFFKGDHIIKDKEFRKKVFESMDQINKSLTSFDFIQELPVKKDKDIGVRHSDDFIILQGIRSTISEAKSELMDYIKYKNKKGWS